MRNVRIFGIMIFVYFVLGVSLSKASGIAEIFRDYVDNGSGTTISSDSLVTTGASLIVVGCSGVGAVSSITNSGTADSWTLLTAYGVSGSGANYSQLGYAYSPTTSAIGQAFTCTWSTNQSNSAISVFGFSGTMTTSAVLDSSVGSSDSTSTSVTTPAIFPSVAGEVFVVLTSNGLDFNFSCTDLTYLNAWIIGSVDIGDWQNNIGALYLIDSTTDGLYDTFDFVDSAGDDTSAAMASFRPLGAKEHVLGSQQ